MAGDKCILRAEWEGFHLLKTLHLILTKSLNKSKRVKYNVPKTERSINHSHHGNVHRRLGLISLL